MDKSIYFYNVIYIYEVKKIRQTGFIIKPLRFTKRITFLKYISQNMGKPFFGLIILLYFFLECLLKIYTFI